MQCATTVPADILTSAYDAAVDLWNGGISLAASCIITATDYAARGYDRSQILAFLDTECATMRKLTHMDTEE